MVLSRLSLHKHIRRLRDPRLNRRKRHLLGDILTIAICAVIAGANTWPDIETFGRKRLDWLQRFLELPNGIPSHDTFERSSTVSSPKPCKPPCWAGCMRSVLLWSCGTLPSTAKPCGIPAVVPRPYGTCTW